MSKKKPKKRKRRIPKRFIAIDKISHTTYLQSKKTGRMMGRKRVVGSGDLTRVRRVKKGKYVGMIWGRTSPIKIRGSKNKRGGTRKPVRRL